MKKLIFTLLLGITTISGTMAQDNNKKNILGIAIGSVMHPRIKYEHIVNEKFTLGGIVTAHIAVASSYYGGQVAPIGRYYFVRRSGDGMYLQGKVPVGYYWLYNRSGDGFFSAGLGVAVGYQVLIKNSNWSIDTYLGLQGSSSKYSSWGEINKPGSTLDGHLSVGYRF